MLEKDRRSTVRRADDQPRRITISTATDGSRPAYTTLWRMRSATGDNQASCSVAVAEEGCEVLVVFTKGFGVPEYFSDVRAAMHHSMDIAGRLIALGWIDLDIADD